MAKFRDRVCVVCGDIKYNTATKSDTCIKCYAEAKRKIQIVSELKRLTDLGYVNIEGPSTNKFGHPEYAFTHVDCGTRQTWAFTNLLKRIKAEPNIAPCSKCGGVRRGRNWHAGYMAIYGITPEQMIVFEMYARKVRNATAATFKKHREEINPNNLHRSTHSHHLDHKVTVWDGFKHDIPPEWLARKENLQMLTARDNMVKGRKSDPLLLAQFLEERSKMIK